MTDYDPLAISDYLAAQLSDEFWTFSKEANFFKLKPPQSDSDSNSGSDSGEISSLLSPSSRSFAENNDSAQSQLEALQKKIDILNKIELYSRLKEQPDADAADDDKNNLTYDRAAKFFSPYVDKQADLIRLYSVLRGRFRKDLKNESKRQSAEFAQRVGDLLILGSVLKGMHRHGLNVPRGTRMYLRDQKLLDGYLSGVIGFETGIKWESEPELPEWGTQTLRDLHQRGNLIPRLFVVRLRRDIAVLAQFIQGDFLEGFRQVEQGGTLFFFSHLAWIFFLPRLLTNIGLIYKHVFDESAMTEVERRLGWDARLRAQLVRRWSELFNDAAWLSSGITTCFFLVGKAPAIGLYLAVAMQGYDLLLMIIRFIIEVRRLNQLKADLLEQRGKRGNFNENDMELLRDLEARMAFDRSELWYNAFNFTVLLLCAILISPHIASISPILPIMAATTAVLITLITFAATRWFAYQRQKMYDGELILSEIHCVKTVFTEPDLTAINKIDLGVFAVGYIRVFNKENQLLNIIYVNKRTKKIVDFCKEFGFKQDDLEQFGSHFPPPDEIKPGGNKKFKILEEAQQKELISQLQGLQKNTQDLELVEKTTLWQGISKKTSKSVSNFSNTVLGIGG